MSELFFMWQNLVFVLPFIAALFYLVLQTTGALGDHGAEHDVSVDHDVSFDHDIDHDIGVEHSIGDGGETDHDAGSEQEQDTGTGFSLLSLLGVGRVPLSIIVMSFLFLWGFSGWASNQVFGKMFNLAPNFYVWLSLVIALVCSVVLTRGIAGAISHVMPSTETYLTTPRDFIGKIAKVRYTVDEEGGGCNLYDKYGRFQELQCRVKAGDPTGIPPDTEVIITGYRSEEKYYLVRPSAL